MTVAASPGASETSLQPVGPRLCLVRHGQGSLGTPDYDRLSPLGQRQGLLLGERIRGDYLAAWQAWSGSLRRHRQTLERIAPPHEAIIEDALNEYMVDRLVQSAVNQAAALRIDVPGQEAFADPEAYLDTFLAWFPEVLSCWQQDTLSCAHNGRWNEFHQRVLSPLARWKHDLGAGRSAVVVTSAGVISTITAELLGHDLGWQRELNITLYNASVTELALDANGHWQAVRINCVDHLDQPLMRTLA